MTTKRCPSCGQYHAGGHVTCVRCMSLRRKTKSGAILLGDNKTYLTTCMNCGDNVTALKPDGVLCDNCRRENKRIINFEYYLRKKALQYTDKAPDTVGVPPLGFAPMRPGRAWKEAIAEYAEKG